MFTFIMRAVFALFDFIVAVCHGRNINLRGFSPNFKITEEGSVHCFFPNWWRFCTSITFLAEVDNSGMMFKTELAYKLLSDYGRGENPLDRNQFDNWRWFKVAEEWVTIPIVHYWNYGGEWGMVELRNGSQYYIDCHRLHSQWNSDYRLMNEPWPNSADWTK